MGSAVQGSALPGGCSLLAERVPAVRKSTSRCVFMDLEQEVTN